MSVIQNQVRKIFLGGFFGAQLLAILWGLLVKEKYFNWVPYDEISYYQITVTLPSGTLSAEEIYRRYRKKAIGRENRKLENLISLIRQYEQTYGKNDRAIVHLTTVTNSNKFYQWSWPEDCLQLRE